MRIENIRKKMKGTRKHSERNEEEERETHREILEQQINVAG